jgi:hypothetical protein
MLSQLIYELVSNPEAKESFLQNPKQYVVEGGWKVGDFEIAFLHGVMKSNSAPTLSQVI